MPERHQFLRIERRAARQQFVEQHAQAVDVAARVDVQPAHLRLFRTHVRRRADELLQLRVNRLVRQPSFRRLGNAEINHLRHRHAVVQRDQDVRRLDVAMDDALLMRVLDRLADLDEQIQPFLGGELVLVAVLRDADAPHQFHHEIWPAQIGGARIQHLGDVRMIHHRQRLPLRLEPRDHRLGVHPQLDDLQRDRRRTGSVCSATYTTPQPPSPIRSINLYRPTSGPRLRPAHPPAQA